MSWQQTAYDLKQAGFSDPEINAEAQRQRQDLASGGFSPQEVDEYFGIKEPDMTPVKTLVENNMKNFKRGENSQETADTIFEAIEAGFQMSSGNMAVKALKGKSVTPDMLLPEDASTFYRVASQAGTIAGDIPAMVVGTVFGSAIGASGGTAVAPGPGTAIGTVLGGGAGGNMLPTAIREVLMQYYEKGEIKDFKDFWERTSAVLIDSSKSGLIGAATMGVGKGVTAKLGARALAPAAVQTASTASEIATMVSMGRILEGEAPNAQDFLDASLLIGGLHIAAKTQAKLRQIYAKTGVRPAEVVTEAKTNPVLQQELLSEADTLPGFYEEYAKTLEESPRPAAEPAKVEPAAPKEPTAQDTILAKVGDKVEKQTEPYTKADLYKDFIDRLDPIQQALKDEGIKVEDLKAKDNPYKLARMANDFKAKTQYFFEKGTLDFRTLAKTGKSFDEIVNPFKEDMNGLKAYLISKRAVELEGRQIKSGFDLEAAKTVVKEGKAKYDKAAKDLTDFQNSAVQYLRDSGVISDQQYDSIIEANKSYVSFKRVIDDNTGSGGKSAKNPIKKIKGSDRKIQDPFISMIDNIELYTRLAEKNRASLALVDQVLKNPDQSLISKVKQPMKPVRITVGEAAEGLVKKGADGENITLALMESGLDQDLAETFTVFRGGQKTLGPNEFEVYRKGVREVYETEPNLAEALRTLEGNATSQNFAVKIARGITTVKRVGISLMPDFILRNLFRDQLTAGVLSQTGKAPFMEIVTAMGDLTKKTDAYYNWLKSGGANGAFLELSDKYINENVYKLDQKTGFIDKTWNLVTKPMHYLELAGSLAEQSTRLAEAKRVMGKAESGAAIFEAGFASREATIDFQRMGAKVAALNSITAFMNAGIQGLDRSMRAAKADPKGIAIKAGTYITAPSILLWWANKDDQRVKEIPQWQKDLFWIIPTDNWTKETMPGEAASLPAHLVRPAEGGGYEINKGVIYRLPKPQEIGIVFGSLPERILEAFFTDNPEAFGEFGETLQGLISPAFVPDALSPIFEQWANKSTFTDNKIVPGHLEGIMPQYQYTDYTSDTAKMLGKLVMTVPGLGTLGPDKTPLGSPMVLENYIRSWSGSMGMYALQLADKGLQAAGLADVKVKPAASVSDIPFVKAFVVRNPSANTKSIAEFDKIYSENKMVMDTIKSLSKRGNLTEAEKLMLDPELQSKMANFAGVQDAIKNQAEFIQRVYRDPSMSPDEKRQIIDGVYYGMTETAKAGLTVAREFRKSFEEQKAKGE